MKKLIGGFETMVSVVNDGLDLAVGMGTMTKEQVALVKQDSLDMLQRLRDIHAAVEDVLDHVNPNDWTEREAKLHKYMEESD